MTNGLFIIFKIIVGDKGSFPLGQTRAHDRECQLNSLVLRFAQVPL